MRRLNARRQQEGETHAEFEHALRTMYSEAWSFAEAQAKDSALRGKSEEGLNNAEMA